MGLTVREALAMEELEKIKLIAGHLGLERKINFVNIMEIPEVADWMKGGEFLLTSGYALDHEPGARKKLVYQLAQKGIAALGIKLGKHLREIPQDMIEVADEVEMPLLLLPEELPYMNFMVPISEALINGQIIQLKRSEEIHKSLLEVIVKGGGFDSLCRSLYELVNNPVMILDRTGTCLASFSGEEEQGDALIKRVLEKWSDHHQSFFSFHPNQAQCTNLDLGEKVQTLALEPIKVNEVVTGFLVVLEDSRPVVNRDLAIMEYASPIVALVFVKEKAVFDAQRQAEGEFLGELLANAFTDPEMMLKRAGFLNFDLKGSLVVFVISINVADGVFGNSFEILFQELKSFILRRSHEVFVGYTGGVLFQMKSDSIVGLVGIKNQAAEETLRFKCREIESIAKKKQFKGNISIGVGRAYSGIHNIEKSYQEALAALRVNSLATNEGGVYFFQDLGAYRFLYELKESDEMKSFHEEMLGKIKKHDAENQSNLLETVIYYFQNDANLRRTAEKMFVHRNSVVYRIKQIEEITGLDLRNTEDCFNLQLSLKLGRLLE